MWRAPRSRPARTSSLTAFAFAPGELNTGMPRCDSSATGMLLVPAPARPTASTLAGISMSCMSAERTRIASGRPILAPVFVAIGRQTIESFRRDAVQRAHAKSHQPFRRSNSRMNSSERRNARQRHRVVKARAHSADRAVARQIGQALGLSLRQESLVELRPRQTERNVHPGPAVRSHWIRVEARGIDGGVEHL